MLFVIIVSRIFDFDPTLFLITTFSMHTVTMLVPVRMPYLIRSLTKTAVAIGLVNGALILACLVPYLAPVIAVSFIGSYFLSILTSGIGWLRPVDSETCP